MNEPEGHPIGSLTSGVVAACLGCNQEYRVTDEVVCGRLLDEHTGPGHRLDVRGYKVRESQ